MFTPVLWREVNLSELTVSRPVFQYQANGEKVSRASVALQHPLFLVELPLLQLRFDVVPGKFSHFRLYLEPYGPVVDELRAFFTALDAHLLRTFPGTTAKPTVDEADGLPHVHVRIPSKDNFSVFDASGSWLEEPFPLPKGALVQAVLDLSEARLSSCDGGSERVSILPRLFQCKVHTCPRTWCGAKGKKPLGAEQPVRSEAPRKSSTTAAAVKFVPDLGQIMNIKRSLRKVVA